jgi:hypothetical protein
VKISNTRIANVYQTLAKGSIPPGYQSFTTTGQSIYVELNVVATKPPLVSGGTPTYLPLQCRLEFKLPNDSAITDAEVENLLEATVAVISGGAGTYRVSEMMRGVLASD